VAADGHPFRDLRDVMRAVAESVFYRRAIFDPPPWPHRFRLFLPIRKARR
jgi:hypothetical protein